MKKYIVSLCILLLGALGVFGQVNVMISPSNIANVPYGGGTYYYSHNVDTTLSYSYSRFYDSEGRVQSVTGNSIVFKNSTGGAVSGSITLYFWSDIGEISGTLSYSQQAAPANYSIQVTPNPVMPAASGGGAAASVSYKDRAGAPSQCVGISGQPSWCTVTANGASLSLSSTPNQTMGQRQATITVVYSTPGGNQSASFTVTQPAMTQWINLSPTSLVVNANGGNHAVAATHSFDSIGSNLVYYNFSDTGGQVTGASTSTIYFKKNDSNVTKTGNVTLRFRDPYNYNNILTAMQTVYYSQAPLPYNFKVNNVVGSYQGGTVTGTVQYVNEQRSTTPISALGGFQIDSKPAWCENITYNGAGTLYFTLAPNSLQDRESTIQVSFNNPIAGGQRLTAQFKLTQSGKDYAISVNSSASAHPQGGNCTVTLRHTHFPTEPFAMVYQAHTFRTASHKDHITVTPGTNANELLLNFKTNKSGNTISGYIDLTYKLVGNEGYTKPVALYYSQEPRGEGVFLTTQHMEFPAGGGDQTLDYEYYVDPNHPVVAGPSGDSIVAGSPYLNPDNYFSGLPAQSTVQQFYLPNTIKINVPANETFQPYTNVAATLNFLIGLVSYPASITYTQQPAPCTIAVNDVTASFQGGTLITAPIRYTQRLTSSPGAELTGLSVKQKPDWCRSITYLGGGILYFEVEANPSMDSRSGPVEISFDDPIAPGQKVTTGFTLTQSGRDYAISVNSSASAHPQGGNCTVTLRHTHFPTEPFAMVYQAHTFRTASHKDHITVTPGTNANELLLNFKTNKSGNTISGYIDLTYKLPGNDSYEKTVALYYSQEPRGEGVFAEVQHLEFAPAGGTHTIDYEYFVREDHVVVTGSDSVFVSHPILDDWSGLPQGTTVTLQGNLPGQGQARITLPANESLTSYNGTATISFKIGLDDHPITFTYEQKPLPFDVVFVESPERHCVLLRYAHRLTTPGGELTGFKVDWGKPEWCGNLEYNGAGKMYYYLHSNLSAESRESLIQISFDNPLGGARITAQYRIFQQGVQGWAPGTLSLSQNHLNVIPIGKTIILDINYHSEVYVSSPQISLIPTLSTVPSFVTSEIIKNNSLSLYFYINRSGVLREGTMTLRFLIKNALGTEIGYAEALVTYSQPPLSDPVLGESIRQRIYWDASDDSYHQTNHYLDGLSRTVQSVAVGASPAGGDVVEFFEYDRMGRADSVSYMPYITTSSNAARVANPVAAQRDYYDSRFDAGNYARSYKVYDSGTGLVMRQNSVGESYSLNTGYHIQMEYRLNTANDQIRRYRIASTDNSSLVFSGYYAGDQLTVTRMLNTKPGTPDQDQEVYEYADALGQVVARETRISTSDRRMTYFVYDDLGRERYVLPPALDTILTAGTYASTHDQIRAFAYYTAYNAQGLPSLTQNPGADPVVSLYDKRGRLRMSQDGNQAAAGQWSFVKYDELNRPVISGVISGGTAQSHQSAIDASSTAYEERSGSIHDYTNQLYPVVTAGDCLNVTYYDDHDWATAAYAFSTIDALDNTPAPRTKGLATGSKTKVLGVDTDLWLSTANYYDDRYRPIQTTADLYPSGVEVTSNAHNFTGQVTRTKVRQTVAGQTYGYDKYMNYDTRGRLLEVKQKVNGDDANGLVTLAAYEYDELGQLFFKAIHNSNATMQYGYDLQGRLRGAVSEMFTYALDYDMPMDNENGIPRYDGNIGTMYWGKGFEITKAYEYKYDRLSQLTDATLNEVTSAGTSTGNYREGGISYDRMGNIRSLMRTDGNGQTLHTLGYNYDGNRLTSVTVNGAQTAAYAYDKNGNMKTDGRRGVQITYNVLNLPQKIAAGTENISYIYSAAGQKLAMTANGSSTYYRGGVMVYDGNDLSYMLHPEGTISYLSGQYTYNYFLKDHVGSTRKVLAVRSDNTVDEIQSTDYYPFGLAYSYDDLHQNKYLFGGKELQDGVVNGKPVELYDFHARFYDPFIARWMKQDRYARKYTSLTPYSYAANNPILYVDPTGDTIVVNIFGRIISNSGIDQTVVLEKKNGERTILGDLNHEVDISQIYDNVLWQNTVKARSIYNPFSFRKKVANNGEWDLKNDKGTIYGLGNDYGTTFDFKGQKMKSEDIGNHHFGVVVLASGLFSEEFALRQAGEYQMNVGTSRPEWQEYETIIIQNPYTGPTFEKRMLPPYGDDPNDQYWIKQGFQYYKSLKK